MPTSLLPIAQSQLGNNGAKYQNWAGIGSGDWCAAFVSWCANQAGYHLDQSALSDSIYTNPPSSFPADSFPMYVIVGRGASWFQHAGRLHISKGHGGNYTPNPGDVIFFAWDSSPYIPELWHTGIVESVSNGIIYTIEGNSSNLVRRRSYSETDTDVCYFASMSGTSLNVSDNVIAAICGNFWRESTVNPGIWESLIVMPWDFVYDYTNKGGYGLGGFTNTYQSLTGLYDMRLERYHDWCVANGYSEDDGAATLYYIVFIERLWAGHYDNDDFDNFLNTSETDLYTLTDQWCTYWEGNPGDHMPERFSYAQQALAYINQHKNDSPSDYHWITGNFYNGTDAALNNIMCLYFWFRNYYTPGGGGGGGSSSRKGRIPVWMMLRNPGLFT